MFHVRGSCEISIPFHSMLAFPSPTNGGETEDTGGRALPVPTDVPCKRELVNPVLAHARSGFPISREKDGDGT
jgi:hypothetical protein